MATNNNGATAVTEVSEDTRAAQTDVPEPDASSTRSGDTGFPADTPPRQSRPLKVDAHYPVARMTYLTVSTEDLAAMAASSGIGSLALSASIYLYKADASEAVNVALAFAIAIAIFAYLWFGGLLIRIRKRCGLSWWNILGE